MVKSYCICCFYCFFDCCNYLRHQIRQQNALAFILDCLNFLDVGFFLVADYCKSLVVEKVLPYLDNVEQIDFGMSEDDEEEARNEEDSEDEDDEDDI